MSDCELRGEFAESNFVSEPKYDNFLTIMNDLTISAGLSLSNSEKLDARCASNIPQKLVDMELTWFYEDQGISCENGGLFKFPTPTGCFCKNVTKMAENDMKSQFLTVEWPEITQNKIKRNKLLYNPK